MGTDLSILTYAKTFCQSVYRLETDKSDEEPVNVTYDVSLPRQLMISLVCTERAHRVLR